MAMDFANRRLTVVARGPRPAGAGRRRLRHRGGFVAGPRLAGRRARRVRRLGAGWCAGAGGRRGRAPRTGCRAAVMAEHGDQPRTHGASGLLDVRRRLIPEEHSRTAGEQRRVGQIQQRQHLRQPPRRSEAHATAQLRAARLARLRWAARPMDRSAAHAALPPSDRACRLPVSVPARSRARRSDSGSRRSAP